MNILNVQLNLDKTGNFIYKLSLFFFLSTGAHIGFKRSFAHASIDSGEAGHFCWHIGQITPSLSYRRPENLQRVAPKSRNYLNLDLFGPLS